MVLLRHCLRAAIAVLIAWHCVLAQSQTPVSRADSLVGAWLVTVAGEQATRTLVISDVAPSESGALLGAKYGMSSGKQSPIEARMIRVGGIRQLHLITQAATNITATEQRQTRRAAQTLPCSRKLLHTPLA